MRLLLDADVLVKLGRLGLLGHLEKLADAHGIELQWLGSAFFTMGLHQPDKAKTIRRCGRREVVDILIDFCSRHPPIEVDIAHLPPEHRTTIGLLMSSWAIHEGEAILFASAALSGAHVLTDDLRAIEALASDAQLREIRGALHGKWVNLLQLVEVLIRALGFDLVKDQVVKDLESDGAIRAIFGSGPAAREQAVADALAHYIHDRQCKGPSLVADLSFLTAGRPRTEM